MAKVRDINDQPSKSCLETVANWVIWKKILVGVGIVLAAHINKMGIVICLNKSNLTSPSDSE